MSERFQPIAVVGVSTLFPKSKTPADFWQHIVQGDDLVGDVPPTHWLIEDYFDADPKAKDKVYHYRGGFIDPYPFDVLEHGIPPALLPQTDSTQLLALEMAKYLLTDALGADFRQKDLSNVSIVLGVTSSQELIQYMASRLQHPVWRQALKDQGIKDEAVIDEICQRIAGYYADWKEGTFPGLLGNVVAGRIANRFNTGGTNCVTDAACASAFAALQMAIGELQTHVADAVITGGADTLNDIFMHTCFCKTPALSASGECAPFSDKADGTLLGEGLAFFMLKRLEDAQKDGSQIYGVIRGMGSSSDGRAKSVYAPVPEGQARAIQKAQRLGNIAPETIGLVEAHGTATKAGDAAEFGGLTRAFEGAEKGSVALGSVKSQIGHTKATAGAAGLFKALMALHHQVLPVTIKIQKPNPQLRLEETPFYLNTQSRPWFHGLSTPRRAGVSSFGFGGSNFHVILEEYQGPQKAKRLRVFPDELVLFSAERVEDLSKQITALLEKLPENTEVDYLRFYAEQSQRALHGKQHRLSVLADSNQALKQKLEYARAAIAQKTGFSEKHGIHYASNPTSPKIAALFPGQGSQYVGMGAGLLIHSSEAMQAFCDAQGGRNLHQWIYPIPAFEAEDLKTQAALLNQTDHAQASIALVSLSYWHLLQKAGVHFDAACGHSFGELSALYAANAYEASTLLDLAIARGQCMQEAARAHQGSMMAVFSDVETIQKILSEQGIELAIANVNSPSQVIVSGLSDAVKKAKAVFVEQKIRIADLPVGGAFHSPLMDSAKDAFASHLSNLPLNAMTLPVYSTVTGKPYENVEDIKHILKEQITQPVQFKQVVEQLYADGHRIFVEVGPKSVLSHLVKQIIPEAVIVPLDAGDPQDTEALFSGLGLLFVHGVDVDWNALFEEYKPVDVPIKLQEKAKSLYFDITGTSYGKPYPTAEQIERLTPSVSFQKMLFSPIEKLTEWNFSPAAEKPKTIIPPIQKQESNMNQEPLIQKLKSILSEKTGYPEDMLELNMHLESDLGVDSIKRVEILAAVQEQCEGLPEVDPMEMATLNTLQEIIDYLSRDAGAVSIPSVAEKAPSMGVNQQTLVIQLKSILSEKTGYPEDMLEVNMHLESDLGVDSIKRVEILAAVQDQCEGLPEVDPMEMATLNTLQEIIDYLSRDEGEVSTPPVMENAPSVGVNQETLVAQLKSILAEKTGYPEDMLELNMHLESDLGVDSIKRVEILAAVQEQCEGLPEVDPMEMATLNTLQEIIDYLSRDAQVGGSAVSSISQSTPSTVKESDQSVGYLAELVPIHYVKEVPKYFDASALIHIIPDDLEVSLKLQSALQSANYSVKLSSTLPENAQNVISLFGLNRVDNLLELSKLMQAHFALLDHFQSHPGKMWLCVLDSNGSISANPSARSGLSNVNGLIKVAKQEWPHMSIKSLDIAARRHTSLQISAFILEELQHGGDVSDIMIRNGVRYQLQFSQITHKEKAETTNG